MKTNTEARNLKVRKPGVCWFAAVTVFVGFGLIAESVFATTPFELELIVKDGDGALGTTGTLNLIGAYSLAINSCGSAYFYARTTELDEFSTLRDGIWEGSGATPLDIAIDGQVLPQFMPTEEECIGFGPNCGQIFNTSSVFYVTESGEIVLRTSREDNNGRVALLNGTARNNLTPILESTDTEFPFNSPMMKTAAGAYQAGTYIGTKPFGEPDGGLKDFAAPLIGAPAPVIGGPVTITDVIGTNGRDAFISFGFNQSADLIYLANLSDGGEALYHQRVPDDNGSISTTLLAHTGDVPPGIANGAYLQLSFAVAFGSAGSAQINDSRVGFFYASWWDPDAPQDNLNLPRKAIWRYDGSPQLVVSEYVNPFGDMFFTTSEFTKTAFDNIFQPQIAANGDIWFFAVGRRVKDDGFIDSTDERAGLWRDRPGGGQLELVWRITTSDAPGSLLPDGPNVPGTPLPDGTFFLGTDFTGYGLDEHSHIVFAGPAGLYAEDTSGMRLVASIDQALEIAPSETRIVKSFSFNRRGLVGGVMPSYRNDQLVFMANFTDNSSAIYRTSKLSSFARPLVVNSLGNAVDADTTDGFCDTGQLIGCQAECTLRAAIQQSNAKADKQSIHFNIPAKFKRDGIFEISINSNLPIIDDPVIIDASTQPGYQTGAPVVELNAKSMGNNPSWGFDISAGNSEVMGFWINSLSKNAIRLQNQGGNVIQSNIIGTNINKDTDVVVGEHGIWIVDSPGNTIGGESAAERNVIAASGAANTGGFGIAIEGASSSGNKLLGNYIGTNVAGDAALGNGRGGVLLLNAPGNFIGGSASGAGNVISGNLLNGIQVEGALAANNLINGNIIGLDSTSTHVIPNKFNGIYILPFSGDDNVIGGSTDTPGTGAGNTISGNLGDGIWLGSPGQKVMGNIVGTSSQSSAGLGNSINGIRIESKHNLVGTDDDRSRNVISGNTQAGILITSIGESNNIDANFIGIDMTGTTSLPNNMGIVIRDSALNKVGFKTRNVVSGNVSHGILVAGNNSKSNHIEKNYIGSDKFGFGFLGVHFSVGNGGNGVRLMGASNTFISQNIISDNGAATSESGILIHGMDEDGNVHASQGNAKNRVINNFIGSDLNGAPLGNTLDGVLIIDSSRNQIGPGNLIQSNGQHGINLIHQTLGEGNIINGNNVSDNAGLGIDLGFDGVTLNDVLDTDNGANGLQNFPAINSVIGAPLNLVQASINSQPNKSYTIELFTNTAADNPSGHGEGEFFHGAFYVTTDSSGFGSFTAGFGLRASNNCVSATARDDSTGDTSEFSLCVTIPPPVDTDIDFGDAPGGPGQYPTLLANNGARHQLGGGLYLGGGVDADLDGQPDANAGGDDADGNDDEQGVTFVGMIIEGSNTNQVEVIASADGLLDAWIDFDGDGDWGDLSDQVFASLQLQAGSNLLNFAVPQGATAGTTFARFRISTAGNLNPIGPAIDGEVEDHQLTVTANTVFNSGFEDPAP